MPRTSDDADTEAAETIIGACAESLGNTAAELGHSGDLGGGRPERQIVADDVDRGQGLEPAVFVHESADHAPITE